MSETPVERRVRVCANLPNGFENGVGYMTTEETLAAAVHLIENLSSDQVFEAIMVAIPDSDEREELLDALNDAAGL